MTVCLRCVEQELILHGDIQCIVHLSKLTGQLAFPNDGFTHRWTTHVKRHTVPNLAGCDAKLTSNQDHATACKDLDVKDSPLQISTTVKRNHFPTGIDVIMWMCSTLRNSANCRPYRLFAVSCELFDDNCEPEDPGCEPCDEFGNAEQCRAKSQCEFDLDARICQNAKTCVWIQRFW